MNHQQFPPVVALVGPTAVGKSSVAIRMAQRFPFDVVTADSRQVYRYMDIGTAKPTREEQAAVRHYMIDLAEPDDTYSAARFVSEATRVLQRIAAMGRAALIVGGTGFYVQSLLDGLSLPGVVPDPRFRCQLEEEARVSGSAGLHRRLARLDPRSAERIHPNNLPRIIRALEIVQQLGTPVPNLARGSTVPALYIGLTLDRPQLRKIADERVRHQVRSGLAEETAALLSMGYDPALPSLAGFGYSQMVAHLNGDMTLPEAIEAYQKATHAYIRRQMTWFRSESRISWITSSGAERDEDVSRLIDGWLSMGSPDALSAR